MNRILDLSERPAQVHLDTGALKLDWEDGTSARVPIQDLAAVVSSHPSGSFSHRSLAALSTMGIPVVLCDEKRLPCGMLIPLTGNFAQAERQVKQAEAPLPKKKRAWQSIVRAKIRAQVATLERLGRPEPGLAGLITQVRSGDPDNIEAQAARRYWIRIFGDESFRRVREAEDLNRHLNYGYAVLRAIVARAICAAGLHPTLGVHHHNRYDSLALVSDLMEPFRPVVDEIAARIGTRDGMRVSLTRAHKAELLSVLTGYFQADDERRTLFDWSTRMADSLVKVYAQEAEDIVIPDIVAP
ncbi:MAG: type II CRISPR-associated endonuclease Cas1, partial [Elusimicrobia bacterium]|nr:type II CRISPR-associated endonuclease Cas1 [Elusimicrobiota bacterium]